MVESNRYIPNVSVPWCVRDWFNQEYVAAIQSSWVECPLSGATLVWPIVVSSAFEAGR